MEGQDGGLSKIKKNYFIGVKFCYVLMVMIYIFVNGTFEMENAAPVFIVAAFCAATMSIYEAAKYKLPFLIIELAVILAGIVFLANEFMLLLPAIISDVVAQMKLPGYYFLIPLLCSIFVHDKYAYILICLMSAIIYYQHYKIIVDYRKSTEDYEKQELYLKNSIDVSTEKFKNEINRTNLYYENMILQDKARLSQELHDKLGHRINGSIYQLEACRAISASNPEKSGQILERVIDSLRTGMDEIRAMLRKERPESRKITMIQLTSLCNECREQYGIEADLIVSGDGEKIDDRIWKVILDNSCEAITNSLKYSGCTKISIEIKILNQLVRCCIKDNGNGCDIIVDGMGIQGMKQRIQALGGMIDVDGTAGFTINMLIPIQEDLDGN